MKRFLERILGRRVPDVPPDDLPVEGEMPEIAGVTGWLNSAPLSKADLRGKVVLVDFWTYSCINCIRTLPSVNAWHETYKDKGLVVLGVHTPEFEFEKGEANVREAIERYGITYPVALDNDYAMWNAYGNRYWPAHYFVDRQGRVRWHHFGEGGYEHSEGVIRALLEESGTEPLGSRTGAGGGERIDFEAIRSPETYLGHRRLEYLGSPEAVVADRPSSYSSVPDPAKNVFYLEGDWEIRAHHAVPVSKGARIVYRYEASRVNLVMDGDGQKIEVRLDGELVPDAAAGSDVKDGVVTATKGRLYSLVDTHGSYDEHLLTLTFVEPGVQCFAFTFG